MPSSNSRENDPAVLKIEPQTYPGRASRSPRPYRRRSVSLTHHASDSSLSDPWASVKTPRTSEDSDLGTEGDDEKGRLVKRLAAPPPRKRKGWKGATSPLESTPGITPCPTPPNESLSRHGRHTEELYSIAQDQANRYAKYNRRRRREVARRSVEALVLLGIGFLSCSNCSAIHHLSPHLTASLIGLVCCYASYPLIRTVRMINAGKDITTAMRLGFHVPSRFDPGILLYPVLLPLFVAAAIHEPSQSILLVNVVLGLASIPTLVVPDLLRSNYYTHWLLSLSPLLNVAQSTGSTGFDKTLYNEYSALYPLHCTVTQTISVLVTTSLDTSEIQLLSAALINLLLFGSSPQSQILKALLWPGAFLMFVLCGWAFRAEVALARIPSWRFTRNQPTKSGLIGKINTILEMIIPQRQNRFPVAVQPSSESDSDTSSRTSGDASRNRQSFARRQSLDNSVVVSHSVKNTMSAALEYVVKLVTELVKLTHKSKSYLRLTYLQAQALKACLALYSYTVTLSVVLVPVRHFVARRALNGNEPFGWAIGYLAGDLRQLRMFTVNNALDDWIRIPTHKLQVQSYLTFGWLDSYRQQYFGAANTRLLLAAYCLIIVACGIFTVSRMRNVVEVDTRRKVFHGVMVVMLLPTIPIDPCFFSLALIIVLAIFLLLDLFRASQLPPISRPLTNFLSPYVDGRDHRGPVIVSPIFLLVGCAIPLWLSMSRVSRYGDGPWAGWELSTRDLSMISGVVCVGMGDAAASLIGRRYGKTKWCWGGGKSIEGSFAFAIAVMLGLTASWLWLRLGGWLPFRINELPIALLKSLLAGMGASMMESTLTAANDNVVVPIGLWLLVRGLQI